MERTRVDGTVAHSDSQLPQPKYLRRNVQEALDHLASIELIELCNEAKVEHCRATRDLRSCGRNVECVLNSCGHASLCTECSERCDVCPICRIPIPKNGNRFRPRLYYECIEAGLISKRRDDRFQEKEGGDKQLTADVERLYSLFDVAMENNLVSLICHYITDVCMDESAVSSDPIIAFLLDEVVVKDWCKRTLKYIMTELQGIYNLPVEVMKTRLNLLLRFSVKLAGVSNVLEVLESSFKGTLSAQLDDLHHLQESILKTKQHMEMMIWCVRHQFLENVRSRHTDFTAWRSHVRERKSDAIMRSWPDSINQTAESARKNGSTLFIEDALLNLEEEQGYTNEMGGEIEIAPLQKDGVSSFFRTRLEGMAGCYPFENLRASTDILFLHGSSDLVVAKRAIFLYYLFDRHWTMPDENWRHIVEDFASAFSIPRTSLLESFTFYLLDDHTDEALQEACRLLPEISAPTTHPKVSQVLLERGNPDAALMVLRWSGRDGGTQLVSLAEAITAVRVRVECGLLTEAFMYQRTLCVKVREKKSKHGSSRDALDDIGNNWVEWVEALVAEICCLCIRRKLVDRMIELPWNADEEKYLHKSLLDFALDDPSTTIGSLLVVFYLQRYRYVEAYQVDRKLQSTEQEFILKGSVDQEVVVRMRSASHWREGLVEKSIELLPEVQQQQVKTGKLPELIVSPALVPSSVDSSLILPVENSVPSSKPFVFEPPSKVGEFFNSSHFELGNYGSSSVPHGGSFTNTQRGPKPQSGIGKNLKFENLSTPTIRRVTPMTAKPLKEFNSALRVPQNGISLQHEFDEVSPETEQNGYSRGFQNTKPYSVSFPTHPVISPNSNSGLFKDLGQTPYVNASAKRAPPGRSRKVVPSHDPMDLSWSYGERGPVEDVNANGGPRWRSDETSEDEDEPSPDGLTGVAFGTTPMRGTRKSRFGRR